MRYLLFTLLTACTTPARVPLPTVIAADGDSLTAGNHASSADKAYPILLKIKLGLPVENLGRPGATAENMRDDGARVDAFYKEGGMVLIWGGVNSYPKDTPTEAFKAMRAYVEGRLKAHWRVGVLTTLPYDTHGEGKAFEPWRASYNAKLRELPGVEIFELTDLRELKDPHDARYFVDDACHLNDAGNQVLADFVYQQLTKP